MKGERLSIKSFSFDDIYASSCFLYLQSLPKMSMEESEAVFRLSQMHERG